MRDTVLFEIFKIVMLPFALIYGFIVRLRNKMYDTQIYKSVRFEIPVISVGNLSVGGTGKTPHIEYLINLLNDQFKVATLSRGYRRKTRGFLVADHESTAHTIGDEPMQFKNNFSDVIVAVSENRMLAIPEMLALYPGIEVILLDDAYQHRSVNPGLSILLTDFDNLYTRDRVLPLGRLREPASSSARADIIIVTKCPPDLSEWKRDEIIEELAPGKYQKVYFSFLEYGYPYYIFNQDQRLQLQKDVDVLLLTGIANNKSIVSLLKQHAGRIIEQEFSDHHYFDRYDLENVRDAFNNIESSSKVIITTEKDAMRLSLHRDWLIQNKLPLFALPVKVRFFPTDEVAFQKDVISFMTYYREREEDQ
ncbi:MAG: tetraacyldisaccharide 4'-kinase [Chitinophagales bacterium]|nr:tetraacyldisaccharide 4'-kinase [Chitinophagales bacterium]